MRAVYPTGMDGPCRKGYCVRPEKDHGAQVNQTKRHPVATAAMV